jgi:hypothetical protein
MAVVTALTGVPARQVREPTRSSRPRGGVPLRHSVTVAVIVLLQFMVVTAEAQRWMAQTPFASLAGSWSGSGAVVLSGGSRERIRCRSTYLVGGDGTAVQNTLRCASDSYRFELTSHINYGAGAITGTWSETTRGVSGTLSGRADPRQLSAHVSAPGFTADLSLATHGPRQTVTIHSEGTDLAGASLTLNRE